MKVHITIDGRDLEVQRGIMVLQAARENGIYIPTFCDYAYLRPHGSCRLCIVEVQGNPKTPIACNTQVEEGMVIRTNTPQLQALRMELLQMLLTEHPTSCLFCQEKDNCADCMITLRKSGVTTGCRSCPKDGMCDLQEMVARIGLPQMEYPVQYRHLEVEKHDPFFDRDYNLCVFCGRCLRVCDHLHFSTTLTYTSRGSEVMIGTAYGRSHLEAGCSFCGACVEVCPTGALSEKTRKWDGKPDRKEISTCPLCSIGCQMSLLVKNGRIMGSLLQHVPGRGSLCVKGRFGITEMVNHPTRLARPQKALGQDRLDISWEEAIRLAAEKLSSCRGQAFGMLVSADSSNEDLYITQKFTRVVMGSNNIRTAASERYGVGLNAVLKLLKNSHSLSELLGKDVVLCIGLDGRYEQSVVESDLCQMKKGGTHIITVFPGLHSLSDYADVWLQPHTGKEASLLQALAARVKMENTPGSPAHPNSRIEKAAELLKLAARPAILIGPSFLHHPDNVRILQAVEDLAGAISARIVALPAEGNLVGSFLMGAYPELLPGGAPLDQPEERERVAACWGKPIPETIPGQDFNPWKPDAEVKLLYLVSESLPNPQHCPEEVIYQNFVAPPEGWNPVLNLPAAVFTEADGSSVNYEGLVLETRAAVQPPGEARPGWQILCRIAQAMGVAGFNFENAAQIRAEIARLVSPFDLNELTGRSQLTPAFSDLKMERACAPEPTSAGVEYPFVLSTQMTEHTYFGYPLTTWVAGLHMLYPEEAVRMNPQDAREAGLSKNDRAVVRLPFGERVWPVQLDDHLPRHTISVILSQKDTVRPGILPADIHKAEEELCSG